MLEMLELRYFLSCVGLFVAALIGVQAPVLSTMNGFSDSLSIFQFMNTTELHKTFIDKVLHTINNMVLHMNAYDHF